MGYICPVATLVKWFPDMRGVMTGVAVCGYGFGAAAMSPFAAWEIKRYGVPLTFWTLGVIYLIVVFAAAQFYANPPQGWRPEGWEPRTAVAKAAGTYDFTVGEALATWQFYLLFLMLFLNVSAGIMIISQASPMAQEMVGMSVLQAAGMVGLISLCNGLGRVFWAWVSDHVGRARVYVLLFLIQALIFFILPRLHDWTMFSIAFGLIGLCCGGGFGTMPSFTADFFGAKAMEEFTGSSCWPGDLRPSRHRSRSRTFIKTLESTPGDQSDYYRNYLLLDISVDCAAAFRGANRSSGGGHIAIGC